METTEKTTTVKINTIPVKDFIKTYVDKQKFYKDAIKNATFDGIKWVPMYPGKAQHEAYWNAKDLRVLYAAYGLLRGKSFSQTENRYPEENHPLNEWKERIEKTLEDFKRMSKIKENGE